MRKLIVAAAFLAAFAAAGAIAQTPPPQANPPPNQPAHEGMKGTMGSDNECPMMKKMTSLDERLKKLEQESPKK
jgi:Spy/CpxP family protein refolding chaperone